MIRGLRSRFVKWSIGLHGVCVLVLIVLPHRFRWETVLVVVLVLLVDHLVLVAGSLWPRSALVGPNLRRLPATSSSGEDVVGLTFDDGPDPWVTPRVLDILDRHDARATFFCIGVRVEQHPELVAEIARRGHRVENHSYRHFNTFCFLWGRSLGREIDRAQEVIRTAAGRAPAYFRAPAGLRNPWLDPVLVSRGLELVSWTRRGFDTVSRDAGRIVQRLVRGLEAGDVVVLHDGSPARDRDGRAVVLEALPLLLDELARRGLRAVAIPPGPGGPGV